MRECTRNSCGKSPLWLDLGHSPELVRGGCLGTRTRPVDGSGMSGNTDSSRRWVRSIFKSGHFIIPSSKCDSEACASHRQYQRQFSSSVVDIDRDGVEVATDTEDRDAVSVAFGTGDILREFAYETVCLPGAVDRLDTWCLIFLL